MQCVNKNLREYQTLKKQSGLPDFVLSAYVGDFLDKYNRFPYLDELPNSNSSKAISEELSLNKDNVTKTENILQATNTNNVDEAVQVLNDKYRDKEIEVLEIGKTSKVYITERPTTNPKIQIQDSIQTELNIIKQKAIANGTFMKAPNGKPTNLTERQWLQVRTKNFKKWFGDWENNPQNASKVVDVNGEPLVVYHNGVSDIRTFKGDSFGLSYFGDSLTSATYGGGETSVFLNIKNPEIIEGKGEEIGDITEKKYKSKRISPPKNKDGVIYKNVKDVGEGIYDWDYEDVDLFWKQYEEQGYGTVYSVQNPNQIKSATDNNGEFSTENDDITDNEVNSFHYFNEVLDKLQTLYGINIIPITNAELNSAQWKDIIGVDGVKAFVYNGDIYLNTDIATVDSPVHEFLHLLLGGIKYSNRGLYEQLINSSEQFETYQEISENYPNRTRGDVNEEVFVTEIAKYLTGQTSALDNLEGAIKYEIFYNINRTLDSMLMGDISVKSVKNPYDLTLKTLAKIVNSQSMVNNFRGSMNDATLNRIMANTKSELMKNGDLREDCK